MLGLRYSLSLASCASRRDQTNLLPWWRISSDCGDFSGSSVAATVRVDCCDHRHSSWTLILMTFSVKQMVPWTSFEEWLVNSPCSRNYAYHRSSQIVQIGSLSAREFDHRAQSCVGNYSCVGTTRSADFSAVAWLKPVCVTSTRRAPSGPKYMPQPPRSTVLGLTW